MEKKKPAKEEIQIVDANRSRNVLLAIKKIDMKNEDLGKAIQNLNTALLSGDRAEILLRCIPTPEEVTSLQVYEAHPEKLSVRGVFSFCFVFFVFIIIIICSFLASLPPHEFENIRIILFSGNIGGRPLLAVLLENRACRDQA